MVNAQEYLDKEYPLERRITITELNTNDKNLEGKLKLTNFFKLNKLDCAWNKLTDLDLSDCRELVHLECQGNSLTSTSFLARLSNPQKLTFLYMGENNFSKQDLSFLQPFINLETLRIWNSHQKRIDGGLVNRFHGSLKYLKEMKKLKQLGIGNTDVDSGLEYLAESKLEVFASKWYPWGNNNEFTGKIKEAKSDKLFTELLPYATDLKKGKYDLSAWKSNRLVSLISDQEKLQEQVSQQERKIEQLTNELNELTEEKLLAKRNELEKLKEKIKSKLEENLQDYLDILLLSNNKSLISEKARKNLTEKINANELQKIMLLQHEVNHLEQRINNTQYQAQIEILPPSYNN